MKPIPVISAASLEFCSSINMLYLKGSIISNLQWDHLYSHWSQKYETKTTFDKVQKIAFFACEVINYSVWNWFHWYLQQAKRMAGWLVCFIWRDLSCVSWNELIYKATEAINMKQNDIWQSAKNSLFRLWSHQLQCMKLIPVISAASAEYGSFINMLYLKGYIMCKLEWAH